MPLAPYVRILGRGPSRARHLTRDELREAMGLILSGEAAPEAVGALLMLMRYRGEVPEEIAGFADAMRADLPAWRGPRPDLDWSCYAAGRTRGVPWFLLSAKLVAQAGHTVLLHGWNSHQNPIASVRGGLDHAGITQADTLPLAGEIIAREGIAYAPLESFAPRCLDLLKLRDVLGLRSAVNTTMKVLNPGGAAAAVQGVFHPPYRELQAAACALLGLRRVTIIKGGGGEFERHPGKDVVMHGLRDGADWAPTAPPVLDIQARRLGEGDYTPQDLARLWHGDLDDPFAEGIVLGTAALAFDTLGVASGQAALDHARAAWAKRH